MTIPAGDSVTITVGDTIDCLSSDGLFVRLDVELDEESQVTGDNTTSQESSRLGSRAVAEVRQTGFRIVSVDVVRVG